MRNSSTFVFFLGQSCFFVNSIIFFNLYEIERIDKSLNLSGSRQQGHSAAYNRLVVLELKKGVDI